jgi:DNA polymerase III subunit delta
MDHQRILRDLQMKAYKPVYLLTGEEPYFIDVVTDYMEEHVLGEAEKVFGLHILYGRDVSMDQVIGTAKSYPMAGDRQVVIVKEAQDMKEWKKSDSLGALEHYVQHPTSSTLLVFTMKGKKADKRLKVIKLIDSNGCLLVNSRLKENQMPGQLNELARERGLKLDPAANSLLVEYLGTHVDNAVNALNKLRVVLSEGSTVTTSHIEEFIGISKDYNVWELQKALGTKNALQSNRIIEYFRANPKENPPQKTIPALYSFFARIALFQSLPDKRKAREVMGLYPAAIDELRAAEQNFSVTKIERIMGHLRDADRRIKGVGNDFTEDDDIMKELVFKIIH